MNKKSNEDNYIPGVGDIFKESKGIKGFADEAKAEIAEMLKLEQNGRK